MNFLHLQWLIPYHGNEWSGKVTSENYHWLFNPNQYQTELQYWAQHPTTSDIPKTTLGNANDFLNYAQEYFSSGMTILSINVKFNPFILIPIISWSVLSVALVLVLYIFKKTNIDILIFAVPIILSSNVFIFCGFLPGSNNDSTMIFLKVAIFFATLISTFLIINWLINNSISHSQLAEQAIIDIVSQEKERSKLQQTLKELKDQYKKQDDLTHIDISKDN